MKYKLIQEYPGSPELGTIVEQSLFPKIDSTEFVYYISETGDTFSANTVENYPKFWEPVYENKQLTIEHIKDFIKIETYRSGNKGGQHVNAGESGIRLTCEEFNFIIDFAYYRSSFQNREICLQALQLFLDTLPDYTQKYYIELYESR